MNWKQISLMVGIAGWSTWVCAQTPPPPPTDSTNAGPSVTVVASDPTALSGTSSGSFTLLRSGPIDSDLTVSLTISGTASNGVDYTTITNMVTIPAKFLAVDIPVIPIVTGHHGNKTVVLTVQTNADYSVDRGRRATVTIVDDIYNVLPPTVALTSPTNGSVFLFPASITLQADASDTQVPVLSVSFYAGDDFLGRATNSPYSLVWTNSRPGKYTLFARAVDQAGQSTLSAPVSITVTSDVPVVSLTSPTNGQNFAAHSNIAIDATASDPGGSIASVAFFANNRLLGTVTNAPYSMVWSNAPSGLFFLQAKAVSESGLRVYSKPVFINVSRR